ncbi:MAG: alcohol dehydrogenase catalytic domain-containing protein [Bryobacterales bacterium]|nr:alcohol dehydrogenase catalytic domain-containing protein [Bryobacterales bacterium]
MLRATMTSPGVIRFDDVPVPVPAPDQVLLRVRRIGVCGSDIHVWHGRHPYTSYPVVQGHEFSAEVAETAAGLAAGTLVTAPPQITCGECLSCRRGDYHICERLKVMGFQAPGVAQEFVALPRSAIMPLPEDFTPELGALVEPLAVAVHALGRAEEVAGGRVLVLGAGPIGNLVAQAARWRGAARVTITDVSGYRLEIARRCGIERCLDASGASIDAALREEFEGSGPDVTFECAGLEETAAQAVRHARKGSAIVVAGVFAAPPRVDLGLVQDRELRLVGTLMYRRGDYADAIRCLSEGGVMAAPLLTVSFPFLRYAEAYRFIDSRRDRVMKVMISLDALQ